MSRAAKKLDPVVAGILRDSTCDGDVLTLPAQLHRLDYVAVNKAITALGGRWVRGRGHVFDRPVKPMLDEMLETEIVPRTNVLDFFPTPVAVVDRMIGAVAFRSDNHVLEPSAGDGAIVGRLLERKPDKSLRVTVVEKDPTRFDRALTQASLAREWEGHCGDFLEYEPDEQFDVVLMNPPFTSEADPVAWMGHVTKAMSHLRYDGVLVAIVPNGAKFRTDKKHTAFRAVLDEDWHHEFEDLPADSFAESGTGVNALMLVAQRL